MKPANGKNFFQRAPLFVFILLSILSVVAALAMSNLVTEQQRSRFQGEVDILNQSFEKQIKSYKYLLESSRAVYNSNPNFLDQKIFSQFVADSNLPLYYPAVQALGFSRWLPDRTISTEGTRVPIVVIAPLTKENSAVIAFNMFSEAYRRDAILDARKTGELQATEILSLQKKENSKPIYGFLLLTPVKENNILQGFLYLAIRNDKFVEEVQKTRALSQDHILVTTMLANDEMGDRQEYTKLPFGNQKPFRIAGQKWNIIYAANNSYSQDFSSRIPLFFLVIGMIVANLAFRVVKSQVSARKETEKINISLLEAKNKKEQARAEFESIFQSMQDAAAFTDASGKIRRINQAMIRQFQFNPEELIGEKLAPLYLDEMLAKKHVFAALTTLYKRKDGSVFSGEAQRNKVLNRDGEILGVLEVIRDVTERVAIERAIQLSERRYRSVLDAIPHIVRLSGSDGHLIYINAQHHSHLNSDEIKDQIVEEDLLVYESMWRRAQTNDCEVASEIRLKLRDGKIHWFIIKVSPIRNENSETVEWVTSATDVNDRLIAERNAQTNEERYKSILESMPQLVWLTDPEGKAIYFNKRWNEYVGKGKVGLNFPDVLHPDDLESYLKQWKYVLEHVEPFGIEIRIQAENGEYKSFVVRGLPITDQQGRVLEWVGTCTDVDDSVYAESAARLLADVTDQLSARTQDQPMNRTRQYQLALSKLTSRFTDSATLWAVTSVAKFPIKRIAKANFHSGWNLPQMRTFSDWNLDQILETKDPISIPSTHYYNTLMLLVLYFFP